jgi:hypothetical protein
MDSYTLLTVKLITVMARNKWVRYSELQFLGAMAHNHRTLMEWSMAVKLWTAQENPVPFPFQSPQIPYELHWHSIQDPIERNQHLTAWALAELRFSIAQILCKKETPV